LDAETRVQVRERVRDALTAEGATALLVTHDREEALSLADHVAVVRSGRVVQAGPPALVHDTPADADVARSLGPVSLLPVLDDTGADVDTPLGRLPVGTRTGAADHVLLRPEQVVATAPGGATATGTVTGVRYRGGDAVLTVAVAGRAVEACTTDRDLRVGDDVALRVIGPVHLLGG
ncbi:MAG TPA: TOBE domain-containing protein, partial [Nocardioides sp.]